jgi:hypothetical protein
LVTNKIGQLVTARVNRAHVATQVVHQDFWRVGTTLQHCLGAVALVIALVFVVIILDMESIKPCMMPTFSTSSSFIIFLFMSIP